MMPQDTTTSLCVIHAVEFQPFESRQGVDTVIGLTFPFNRPIAEILKQCFARYRQQLYDPEHFIHSAGGWLARERCWFVEHAICQRSNVNSKLPGMKSIRNVGQRDEH